MRLATTKTVRTVLVSLALALGFAGAAAAQGMPHVQLDLYSTWQSNCTTGRVVTGATPRGGGYGAWSNPVITSEWNGAPWSCLQARVYSSEPDTDLQVELFSEWSYSGQTGVVASGFSSPGAFGLASAGLITSEWDGAPWSLLSARVRTGRYSNLTCQVQMQSVWSSSCQTGLVSTGQTLLGPGGRLVTEWSGNLITSEWNGAPWSCLSARLVCEPAFGGHRD